MCASMVDIQFATAEAKYNDPPPIT